MFGGPDAGSGDISDKTACCSAAVVGPTVSIGHTTAREASKRLSQPLASPDQSRGPSFAMALDEITDEIRVVGTR